MSFKDIDLVWILLVLVVAAVIYSLVMRSKSGDRLRDKVNDMQRVLLITGVILGVMWMFLPQTASLSTFGYPEEASQVDTPKEVLKYLQRYNVAIVRTIDVVRWTLFIVVFWVLSAGYQLLKVFKERLDKEKHTKDNEAN